MNKVCKQCGEGFEVTDGDLVFYKRVSPVFDGKKYEVSSPSFCPDCRMQRRMSFRNFFNLYHRKSDFSGKKIISMYPEGSSFPVYDIDEWWGDGWDSLKYGRTPDLGRSFFEQFGELYKVVPQMSIVNTQCENTNYCNFSFCSRNCYLVYGNVSNEDCYYGHIVWRSKNCFDCLYVYQSEFCYECIDCYRSYDLAFSVNCSNCSESRFLFDCLACRNCFGCVGQQNKQYCIFNHQYTRDEYFENMRHFDCGDIKWVTFAREKVAKITWEKIVKYFHGVNCENSVGDYLYNCKNVFDSFDAKNCEDIRYCATVESFTDSYDCNFSPNKSELCYECLSVVGHQLFACHNVMNGASDMYYCHCCYSCKDCFGCISLKNKRYCVLNKQYTRVEYEKLVRQIVEKMCKDGEWGEFFPAKISPFAYNESIAMDYYPLSKEKVSADGLRWFDQKDDVQNGDSEYEIPENIVDVNDEICEKTLTCEVTGKPYKIIPQELWFYKKFKIPIPKKCPSQRHKERMFLRNPRKLIARNCPKCGVALKTTYALDRPEKVYCEKCYFKEVY